MTPIQFHKQIRLREARALLFTSRETSPASALRPQRPIPTSWSACQLILGSGPVARAVKTLQSVRTMNRCARNESAGNPTKLRQANGSTRQRRAPSPSRRPAVAGCELQVFRQVVRELRTLLHTRSTRVIGTFDW
jgi:hypothetical protein